jgi:coatomer subunit delta
MEGLLSSFPKLIQKDQHTFVETDQVRYVYQPLDDLYIVLVTNKNSNILQDIDTLQLFSRIVSEYCKSTDHKEITRQRYELILVFDEVISLGYRENINLGQVKTISTMESNDERIQAEIQKNKEREAKEESKRRAQLMDLKKKEQMQAARKGYGDSSMYNQKYTAPVSNYTPPVQQPIQSQFSKPM